MGCHPPPMRPVRAFLFDLDGTLTDTLDDIADAMNHVLRDRGLPTHDREGYRHFVGWGVDVLARRALPEPERHRVREVVRAFRSRYGAHMFDRTAPYPGIPEVLKTLAGRSVPMAVLSNKPDDATGEVVRRLFPEAPFRAVQGHREGMPLKPDPAPALAMAESLDAPPEAIAFVGDTEVDMDTANAAGMVAVGALWGFRDGDELEAHGARHLLAHPRELLDLLPAG